ncbi:MAG: SpoIIIAH-like family protein [Clostridia bacterium]|nr:SpoIIIAH-like family protein [Clostridia bacterium]
MRNEERAAKRMNEAESTELNTVLELPESTKQDFKFKSVFTADGFKNGMKKFGVRNLAIVLSVLVIGASVYVNWALYGKDSGTPTGGDNQASVGGGNTNGAGNTGNTGDTGTGNLEEDYFSAAVIERESARDEALEVLQGVVDDATALDSAKEQALKDIAAMAKVIENESNIETLVKAKGFEDCVAVINGEKASVIVKSEGLQPNHLSQILEIVYLQAGILPENVTIMEK